MNSKVASMAVSVGTENWPTPWAYIEEAGRFPSAVVRDGNVVGTEVVGQGRGVNIHIPTIPALPEDFEFVPGVSRIFVMHRRARAVWAEPPIDFLPKLITGDWGGKADAEAFAKLTYRDAYLLEQASHRLPEPPAIIEPDGSVVIFDDVNAPVSPGFAEQPFLAWRMHHLLLAAVDAGMVKAKFSGGVIGWVWLAQRPFVQYTRDPSTPLPEDPRVALALISDDAERWDDPTGRTVRHA